MPGTKVQVVLCPNKGNVDDDAAQPSWPRPAGVKVEIVELSSGSSTPLGETNDKGVVDLCLSEELLILSEEMECTYRLRLSDYDFESVEFDSPADPPLIPVGSRRPHELWLFPTEENDWLVLLQVTEEPEAAQVCGATVHIGSIDAETTTATGATPPGVVSAADGRIYATATAPAGDVTNIDFNLQFDPLPTSDGLLIPLDASVPWTARQSKVVSAIPVSYWPAVQISVRPTVVTPDAPAGTPLTDSSVTVTYYGDCPQFEFQPFCEKKQLDSTSGPGASSTQPGTVCFEYPFPGKYQVAVDPPASFGGLPIDIASAPKPTSHGFSSGGLWPVSVASTTFGVLAESANFVVSTPQDQPLTQGFTVQIVGSGSTVPITRTVAPTETSFTVNVCENETSVFQIDSSDPPGPPTITQNGQSIPLEMTPPQQTVMLGTGSANTNTIALTYAHSITGQAVDEHGHGVSGATVEIFLGNQSLGVVAADERGGFQVGLPTQGDYYLSQYPEGGEVGRRVLVPVHSNAKAIVPVRNGTPGPGGGGTGREALTDLAAYPVLTEEISTTGPPAPAPGGVAAGGPGAGYGQTVDLVMRDVLGWRPSGDVAGFQAALTGAFELRQVEGHTEWSWQQRGYAVQADMGALTGAQASIYARAKSALDQMLPLLTGLTALNPALYPPQDLEAIRSVITAELKELVNELALEGGPRIQRVDELFRLLTGESRKSLGANPEVVQGQLGTLRDRFGLVEAYVDTVDEERIITNFRIVVEQVLTLQESWGYDRKLLSVQDSNTSFGTILIRLSRGLEAVCESVDDLNFALDSVFVDAAQRQVIQLNFSGMTVEMPELPLWRAKKHQYQFPNKQSPILLSDLLDWVTRASRDEGPKIVQDAGKDGVLAFAPILNELRKLIHATRKITHTGQGATLPDGMRTPRVRRAVEVLAAQLDEAANLATLVRRDLAPEITQASTPSITGPRMMKFTLQGTNFRPNCSVFVYAANREDMPDIPATIIGKVSANSITATSSTRKQHDADGWRDWQVVVTNEDGTTSEPVAIQMPSSDLAV
jgi:hypothetical protein